MTSDPVRAMLPELVTVREAQDRLGMGRTKLYGLIRSGALVSVLHNHRRMILADSIDGYVERRAEELREILEGIT